MKNYIDCKVYTVQCTDSKLISTNVLILDGNSEIGAHMLSDLEYLICSRHLFTSRIVTNQIRIKINFPHTCIACSELPSNTSAMN